MKRTDTKKKVCFVYFAGNDLFANLLSFLPEKEDVEYHYVTNAYTKAIVDEKKITLHKLPWATEKFYHMNLGGNAVGWFKDYVKTLKEIDPDVIVVNDFFNPWYVQTFYYCMRHKKCKLVLYSEMQMLPLSKSGKAFALGSLGVLKSTAWRLSNVITSTKRSQEYIAQYMKNKRVRMTPAGIRDDLFYAPESKKFMKGGVLRLLMVARMVDFKRYFDLLRAVKELKKRKGVKFRVFIRGEGPHEKSIHEFIEKEKLGDVIEFLPSVSYEKMSDYFRAYDCLVLPSHNEAIGMVVPEAMACSMATITSDTVGANLYVKKNETGFIFPVGDHVALADAVEKMYNKGKSDVVEKMALEGANYIAKNFLQEQASAHLYKEVLFSLENGKKDT